MQRKEASIKVSGPFDVKLAPEAGGMAAEAGIGRMALDKTYHGELDATGKGVMLAVRTAVDGSAGYVAMERVTGTLGGRAGSFVLQHSGTMTRGVPGLSVRVVPDSGTEELVGLSGSMNIIIAGAEHTYDFEYSL
jgi:hypothetical protein